MHELDDDLANSETVYGTPVLTDAEVAEYERLNEDFH
jgi:hypothetical protein